MNSDKLLEDLESLVLNASKMPFTNKKMIEEEELLQIIDDLKASMPAELDESKKVLAEKDKIIADAQRHADSMVAQAKDYIAKLTEESELVRQAQEHANQIVMSATKSSQEQFYYVCRRRTEVCRIDIGKDADQYPPEPGKPSSVQSSG